MSASSANNLPTKSQIIAILSENYADLAKEFPIASLELFGSYARDEQTPQSDVDLLVNFSRPMGFGFKPNRRDSILASLIHVAP